VTCLIAKETGAPDGVKPVEWRLLTNRAAPTLDDLVEVTANPVSRRFGLAFSASGISSKGSINAI
jgi:hypothetical protein